MAENSNNSVAGETHAWRYRSMAPKLWFIDGQAFWPVIACFFWPSKETFGFAVVSMLVLHFAARRGYGPVQLIGKARSILAGHVRYRS